MQSLMFTIAYVTVIPLTSGNIRSVTNNLEESDLSSEINLLLPDI